VETSFALSAPKKTERTERLNIYFAYAGNILQMDKLEEASRLVEKNKWDTILFQLPPPSHRISISASDEISSLNTRQADRLARVLFMKFHHRPALIAAISQKKRIQT